MWKAKHDNSFILKSKEINKKKIKQLKKNAEHMKEQAEKTLK